MKTYQKPETDLILVAVQQLMVQASPVENGFNMDDPLGETEQTSGNLSRGRSVWDDEEDEEEEEF